ncbi:NADH:ubiquinone oxidoreductase subunit 5 (subunit L)/multisubunit Na+/H+ antiporter MnhA subunit [Anoxybacillus tengchongensis]|uniref:NADH:ubiquinone oxidoreductase subunit 5 (Subunit L)/multisubunit Na+/H+ antiporter MnhA subunit n=1 Tax=Anoxybacillus tengchongensis TaxID=576944 RepID=A0A7X0D9E0_9BACL|nr:NADH:ubiquinone oxidoreductase subunit 5 (subunit L)/multisubunit Na+/H+ antiporter MnhA subunit [Anoxybacillus tengchongensis]
MNENILFLVSFSIILAFFLLIEFLFKKRKGDKVAIRSFVVRFVSIVIFVYIIKLTIL